MKNKRTTTVIESQRNQLLSLNKSYSDLLDEYISLENMLHPKHVCLNCEKEMILICSKCQPKENKD